MYSLVAIDGREVKKAKKVNKNVVKSIRHEEFVDSLFNTKIMRHKEFKANCIKLELMLFVRFLCLPLMMKDTYQVMELIVWLIFIKI